VSRQHAELTAIVVQPLHADASHDGARTPRHRELACPHQTGELGTRSAVEPQPLLGDRVNLVDQCSEPVDKRHIAACHRRDKPDLSLTDRTPST
jgi:hypothetical protein